MGMCNELYCLFRNIDYIREDPVLHHTVTNRHLHNWLSLVVFGFHQSTGAQACIMILPVLCPNKNPCSVSPQYPKNSILNYTLPFRLSYIGPHPKVLHMSLYSQPAIYPLVHTRLLVKLTEKIVRETMGNQKVRQETSRSI